MHAEAFVHVSNATPYVKLTHGTGENKEEISFTISVFNRKNFQGESLGTFDHINAFWAQLPEEQQNKIFQIYREIEHGIDNIYNQKDLTEFLTDRVTDLVAAHDLEVVQFWVQSKSNIVIPDSFEVDFKPNFDNNTSREKTYTRGDYVRLVSLAVLLRCMIPVWGAFISHIRTNTGTLFKEQYAFQLLKRSSIIRCAAMEKLRTYVEAIVGEDKHNANSIHQGISSEDFCYWLTALICIRRLCVGIVYGNEPRANLVAFVYKFIMRHIQGAETGSETTIRDKKDDDKDTSGYADKVSVFERYKIKSNISPGEMVELESTVADIRGATSRITSQVIPARLERSLITCQDLHGKKLVDPQINLLRWVFKSVISPRGIMYLPQQTVVQALGACEAILWSLGYKYLAILVSSYPELGERSNENMRISHTDSKMQVPANLVESLNVLYPYNRSLKGKKPEAGKPDMKSMNPALKTISDMADNLRMFPWRPTCDTEMLEEVFGVTNRRTPIRPDIKIELAKLVVDIGNRSWS